MSNQRHLFCRTAAVLLSCGFIAGLLPGFAAAQDLSTYEARRKWLIEEFGEVDHTYRTDGQLQSPQVLASLYLSDGQDEAALEHIVTVMEAIAAGTDPTPRRGGDIGGQVRTAAPVLDRVLYMFGDRFSADQLMRIRTAITGPVPEPLNRIARGAEAPYEIRGANGQFGYWGDAEDLGTLRYVWRDRKFAIGGPVGHNFGPDGFYVSMHMFNIVWKSENRLRALEAMHPYWQSNEGENFWRATHSPFQQTGVHRNVAITMFDIPDKDPWPDRGRGDWIGTRNKHLNNLIKLGQVRFPATVDEVIANGDFYFLREGAVYVAIRVLKPGHTLEELTAPGESAAWPRILDGVEPDLFHVIKSREARTGFVFEVGTAEEHGSFGAFQQAVKNNPLRVDWGWGKLGVSYTSTRGDQLRFRYDTDYSEDADGFIKIAPELWINGKQREVDFQNWPLAESPVMTLKDSILRIDQGGQPVEVDWSGELPLIKRR